MSLTVVEEEPLHLAEYARVPIAYSVTELFDDQGIEVLRRGEAAKPVPVGAPYWKDYDGYPDGRPTDWPARFDMSRWTILAAYRDSRRVGGVAVIVDGRDIELLGDCPGCALIWDLRVAPDARGQGTGSALLRAAELRAEQLGAQVMRVETQNVNVPACRVYQRNGYALERATRGAYAELPGEVQLIWRKPLGGTAR
jgi:GNAT superfamily N-acetyltransferase